LADPKYYIPKEVDLLIGAERFWELACVGQIKLGKNKPTLQKTMLGWGNRWMRREKTALLLSLEYGRRVNKYK